MKKLILVVLLMSVLLVACSSGGDSKVDGDNSSEVVKVGLIGSDSKTWNHIKEEAAKEDIEIEIVFFDSYPLPNAALDTGEIDINAFQHYDYLNKEVEQHGYELTVIGETVIAPLGIYSKQIEGIDELEDGDKIAIPDDVTNGGRGLILLAEHGLISIDSSVDGIPELKDIENPRGFEIIELAAANIPASLEEVPAAIINSGIARDAGFSPTEDSLILEEAKESEGENPYVNIIVVRTKDKDNKVYNRIVELYQTDATKKIIEEDTKGASIPVW